MTTFGYSRVSTRLSQKHDRQLTALHDYGIDDKYIYLDNASGARSDRPGLTNLMNAVREGDVVVVCELARLARSLKDLNRICDELQTIGVQLVSLKEKIDTSSAMGRLCFTMIGALAEFERELIVERVRAGVKIAQEKGLYKGTKPQLSPDQVAELKRLHAENNLTVKQLAGMYHLSRTSIYRYLKT